MADRTIILATNDRASYRGIKRLAEAAWLAFQRADDNLKYTIDYTNFLDGGTISTITRTLSGVTATSTSNTTLSAVQKLTGDGYCDIKMLDSNGNTRVDRINIMHRSEEDTRTDDYGF